MKKIWLAILLSCLLAQPTQAQDGTKLYLPLITKSGRCEPMTDPILRVTDGTNVIDLLGPGSGWELADPYWQPQIAQFKGGGAFVDSGLAEGKQLVHREYDNVIETIPLSVIGIDQGAAIQTIRDLLQLGRQASDYFTESYEYDDVWLEAKPACANSLTGYSRIIKMSIPELKNPYGQPFFSAYNQAVMEDLTLVIEREPFWRGTKPGEIIGPLYNLIKNPDFELWNFGTSDAQPDNWTDIQSLWITGENSRDTKPKWGNYALKVRVSGSTKAGAVKGVTQVLLDTNGNTTYTIIAWVRSSGISNGVGRVLVNYSSQLELYRGSDIHGWKLYTGTIKTGTTDIVSINCEILTTTANTVGEIYFDGLMFIEGDWEEEAINGTLPYISSSELVNHSDSDSGDINYIDAWGVPGDVSALVRLEVVNSYNSVYPPEYNKLRIGMRRTRDIFKFDNYNDVSGEIDLTCSGSGRTNIASLNNSWTKILSKTVMGSDNTLNNVGRYRVFIRIKDKKTSGSPSVELRLKYNIGSVGLNFKILPSITNSLINTWEIVDLTEYLPLIWENKFSSFEANQLNYVVDARRTDGSTTGLYIDYSIVLPTDGGFIEINNIMPTVSLGRAVAIDNTKSSINVFGIQKEDLGWVQLYANNDGYLFSDSFGFDGNYFYSVETYGVNSRVSKFKLGQTRQQFTTTGIPLTWGNVLARGMLNFNNKLYHAMDGYLYESDGDSFPGINRINTSPGGGFLSPYDIEELNNNIYFLISRLIFAPFSLTSEVWRWDGAASILFRNYASVNTGLKKYNGKLYIFGATLEEYNPSTGSWRTFPSLASANSMTELNGILYALANGRDIYKFNGNTWTYLSTIIPAPITMYRILTYNNKIFARPAGGYNYFFTSGDGITWTTIYQPINPLQLGVFDGTLFGWQNNTLYSYSSSDIFYSIPNYKGKEFFSPPEKRHRFVLNVDRSSGENITSDSIVVGIGFVPRYLSLINYYPQ